MRTVRRFFILSLFAFLTASSIFSVSLHDVYYKYSETIASVGASVVAAYLNVPQRELPGVRITDGPGLVPERIEFSSSDVSLYKDALLGSQSSNAFMRFLSMAVSSLSPLVENAVMFLDRMAISKGDIIVDGEMVIKGGENIDLEGILSMNLSQMVDIEVYCDIVLSGKSFPNKVELKGDIFLRSDESGTMTVHPSDFTLNGEVVEPGYIRFKGLLKQEV